MNYFEIDKDNLACKMCNDSCHAPGKCNDCPYYKEECDGCDHNTVKDNELCISEKLNNNSKLPVDRNSDTSYSLFDSANKETDISYTFNLKK